jgi:hypothetical protein
MESVEHVINEIEKAFRGVALGKLTLHEAELLDSYSSDGERMRARELDCERDWRDVPDGAIQECPEALSFLDPVSWRFYLPAYIRYGLRHPDGGAVDTAIYSLDPAGIRQRSAWTEERFATLSASQVRAVCLFLRFASQHGELCDHSVATEALNDYWRKREGA